MNSKPRSQASMGLTWGALVALLAIAVSGAVAWLLIRTPDLGRLPALWGFGALGVVVAVLILHDIYETRRIRRAVAEALRGRPPLTDEEFGSRFYDPEVAQVAARLRRLLAENLDSDLGGMIPADDFENWLALSSGPDSAADTFFEELAIEFRLLRDCPWPERFGCFDTLVRFVVANAPACASLADNPRTGTAQTVSSRIATRPLKEPMSSPNPFRGTKEP